MKLMGLVLSRLRTVENGQVALTEIVSLLDEPQLAGSEPLRTVLPAAVSVERAFMARPAIYATAPLGERLEARARANLARSLARLRER